MRTARLAGRAWLPASVAGVIWLSAIFGGGLGVSAQSGQQAASQQSLARVVSQLRAAGEKDSNQQVLSLLQKIEASQTQMATYNHQLQVDQAALASLQVQLTGDRTALINLVSTAYVEGPGSSDPANALAASNMSQFLQSSTLPQDIASQVTQLVQNVQHARATLNKATAQLAADENQAGLVQQQLGSQSYQLLSSLSTPSRAVSVLPAVSGRVGTWSFAFGNCTYWVAEQWRSQGWAVNWGGNADQWWGNAAAAGASEGHTPEVGAIVVWPAGVAGASYGAGHVAYVTALNPDGPGTFEVSEMNFTAGFDRVDYRVVSVGDGYDGFIYPPTAG